MLIPIHQDSCQSAQQDDEILKSEASNLASKLENITYDWSRSNIGNEYRLLAKIISKEDYNHLTNLTWVQETKPSNYDPAITDAPQHTPGREWNKTGKENAKPRPLEKDSSAVLQQICTMPWTKTGTPN